jgi:hypothetical protein
MSAIGAAIGAGAGAAADAALTQNRSPRIAVRIRF